jgi:hypothetical protein
LKTISYKTAVLLSLLVVIYSCKSKPNRIVGHSAKSHKELKKDTVVEDLNNNGDFDEPGIPAAYDSKLIDTLYVTDRDGIEVRNHPDSNSTIILARDMDDAWNPPQKKIPLKFSYGHCLAVIEKKDEWLGVLEGITRRVKENGKAYLQDGWEKVYVRKKGTGKLSAIKLAPEDLRVIVADNGDEDKTIYLKGGVDLTLVDKSEYDAQKLTAVNYLVEDTTTIKKKMGVISLPYQKGFKRYTDNASKDESDNYTKYTYIGQISFLNKYVLYGQYWESHDYNLIDKKTGIIAATFSDYPYISSDKKYIISILGNVYTDTAELAICKINESAITDIISANFKNWVPVISDKNAMFWGTNGCFYVPVAQSRVYNEKNVDFQYLKISIL